MKKIESEKLLERKLSKRVKEVGGMSLKLLSAHMAGLPDRMCLIPFARIFFAEIKTTREKPRKIQLYVHKKLRNLGFEVYVIDTSEQIEEIISNYE